MSITLVLLKVSFFLNVFCALLPPLEWANVVCGFAAGWLLGYIKYALEDRNEE